MSFTSPPNIAQLGLPQTLAKPLTLPNTSADIIVPRKIGTVNCINVARLGESITVRYFGTSAVGAATGQAHPTQAQAEADVLAWADGKVVHYEKHAVVPLGCQATCSKKAGGWASLPTDFQAVLHLTKAAQTLTKLVGVLDRLPKSMVRKMSADAEEAMFNARTEAINLASGIKPVIDQLNASATKAMEVGQPQPKRVLPALPSKEALAALFWQQYRPKLTRKNEPLEADDIRDIMPFDGDELQVQVHMRGYTDWYSIKLDASGELDPTTIEQLPF